MNERTLHANTSGNKADTSALQQAVKKPSPPPPPTQYISESSGKTVPKPIPNGDRR